MQKKSKKNPRLRQHFKQAICVLLVLAIIITTLPAKAEATVAKRKYIYSDQLVFVPSLNESITITWNFQNTHPASSDVV